MDEQKYILQKFAETYYFLKKKAEEAKKAKESVEYLKQKGIIR
ncbi:MAG: hypothetical protein ACLFUH_09265 [Bacteroidales bacterium]